MHGCERPHAPEGEIVLANNKSVAWDEDRLGWDYEFGAVVLCRANSALDENDSDDESATED